uniref:Uncharacterized protein n=1 Tax=Trichogramma kaykai TaxID=54128 RepID=A0ABD2VV73_9HYME
MAPKRYWIRNPSILPDEMLLLLLCAKSILLSSDNVTQRYNELQLLKPHWPDSSDPFEESPAFLCLDAEDGYIDLHAPYDQLSEFTCTRVEQTILQNVTQAPPAKSQLVFAIALAHSFLPRSCGSRLLANCIHIRGRKFSREENAEKCIFRALPKPVDKKPAKARNLVGRFGK